MERADVVGEVKSVRKRKRVDIVLMSIKILILIILIGALLDFSNRFAQTWWADVQNAGNPDYYSGSGAMLFLCGLFLGGINLGVFIISFIVFLFTLLSKHCKENPKHRKHFIGLMIAPFINQVLFILFCFLLFMIES